VFNRSACEHLEHLEHHIALKTMERNKQNEVYMRIREAVEYIGVAMRAMRGYIAEGEYCVNEGVHPQNRNDYWGYDLTPRFFNFLKR